MPTHEKKSQQRKQSQNRTISAVSELIEARTAEFENRRDDCLNEFEEWRCVIETRTGGE
jgi:hypothetical protein